MHARCVFAHFRGNKDKRHTYFHFCCSVAALHWPLAFRSFRSACRLLFVILWHIDRFRKKSRRFINISILHIELVYLFCKRKLSTLLRLFGIYYASISFQLFFPCFFSLLFFIFFFLFLFVYEWFVVELVFFFPSLLFYSCVTHHHRRVRNELQISFVIDPINFYYHLTSVYFSSVW